jgi:hypothetical protein
MYTREPFCAFLHFIKIRLWYWERYEITILSGVASMAVILLALFPIPDLMYARDSLAGEIEGN